MNKEFISKYAYIKLGEDITFREYKDNYGHILVDKNRKTISSKTYISGENAKFIYLGGKFDITNISKTPPIVTINEKLKVPINIGNGNDIVLPCQYGSKVITMEERNCKTVENLQSEDTFRIYNVNKKENIVIVFDFLNKCGTMYLSEKNEFSYFDIDVCMNDYDCLNVKVKSFNNISYTYNIYGMLDSCNDPNNFQKNVSNNNGALTINSRYIVPFIETIGGIVVATENSSIVVEENSIINNGKIDKYIRTVYRVGNSTVYDYIKNLGGK